MSFTSKSFLRIDRVMAPRGYSANLSESWISSKSFLKRVGARGRKAHHNVSQLAVELRNGLVHQRGMSNRKGTEGHRRFTRHLRLYELRLN